MIVIIIDKKQFDKAFEKVLDKLKLEKFRCHDALTNREPHTVDEMHRAFHYHINMLKNDLENS